MTNSNPGRGWVRTMRYEGVGAPAVCTPVDDHLYGYVGQVAIAWGSFEQTFNNILQALLFATGGEVRRSHIGPFRARKKLFREQMQIALANCPHVVATLDKVLNEAAQLHWRRNILLHGEPSTGFPDGRAILVQRGDHNGRQIVLTFDEEALRGFLMRIARMHGLLQAIGEEPRPPSQETLVVRELLENVQLPQYQDWSPNPDKPLPLPRSCLE